MTISLFVERGISLATYLNNFINEKQNNMVQIIRSVLIDIINGLIYMHDKKLSHNDIKMSNVVVVGKRAKLIDF